MPRRVAIAGVGLTRATSHRVDVTYPELVYEAVSSALEQAGLQASDVDAVTYGPMYTFDGIFAPERWNVEACAGAAASHLRPLKLPTRRPPALRRRGRQRLRTASRRRRRPQDRCRVARATTLGPLSQLRDLQVPQPSS